MKDIIPDSLQEKVRSTKWRKEIYKKFGDKAFLKPKELKYPVYDEKGPNCSLIYAAYVRAREFKQYKIAKKAVELFKKNNCEQKLGIHIRKA